MQGLKHMNIGIIGAGQIGGTLVRRLTALGHKIAVANSRGAASLRTGRGNRRNRRERFGRGSWRRSGSLTIPMKAMPQLPPGLFNSLPNSMPVIDTCNYYPRQHDGRIQAIEAGTVESRWVEQQIGHKVVKAFNTIIARHLLDLGRQPGTPGRIALPVCGDETAGKGIVLQLVDSLGFDPIDAGSLDESWRQQPGTPVYCKDFDAAGVRTALSEARNVRTAEWHAPTGSLESVAV